MILICSCCTFAVKKGGLFDLCECASELLGLDYLNTVWALRGKNLAAFSFWAALCALWVSAQVAEASSMPLPLTGSRSRYRQTLNRQKGNHRSVLANPSHFISSFFCPKEISFLGTSKCLAPISTSVGWKFQIRKIWWVTHFGKVLHARAEVTRLSKWWSFHLHGELQAN